MKTIKYIKNNKIINNNIKNNKLLYNLFEIENFLSTIKKTNLIINIIKEFKH